MLINMNEDAFEIKVVRSWDEQEIITLYKEGKWWEESADPKMIVPLIQNSFVFIVAIDKKTKKAIGMGRVLSDGVSDAYIQDVIVLNKWRGKGVGRNIVKGLIQYCLNHHVTWIALISEPNQKDFYVPLGFNEMNKYIPMKYENMI